jgi:ATP-dependent helicase/nuclease subunit B
LASSEAQDPSLAPSHRRGQLFSIPPWRPFADDLAAGLLARHPEPMALARVLLLLPTRRAIRALTDAFVRESDGKALLLPRMVPAGDIEADEIEGWEGSPFLAGLEGPAELLPPVAPQARRLALAKILARARGLSAAEALALGSQLGLALDTLEIEGRCAADLADAVPAGGVQDHWAANAQVLQAVMTHWPALLEERGLVDAARRRNLQLMGLAERWAAQPPPFPVILAGFASAPPAVARLARTVARLPQGLVVMPGLDLDMPADSWALIRGADGEAGLETHPQHGMARLLDAADLSPLEADAWPAQSARIGSSPERATLVSRALLPPELTGTQAASPAPAALEGLRMVEAANPAEEALLVALALRQVVERPGLTAALVTPDRALAARVAVQLQRFGISIDDSAGVPLKRTLPGSLLVALAAAAGEGFAPVPLLTLLQHPLVQGGDARLPWLNQVRALDLHALRRIRPAPGLAGVARRLATARRAPDDLKDWWADAVTPQLAPLEPLPRTAEALLDRLRAVALSLAGEALWTGEAGRALVRLFEALETCRADLAELPVSPDDAATFVDGLLGDETVRPRAQRHPQLAIWGPLEARLQTADLVVMAGLNEGSWPGMPTPDPFLAPVIRRTLGLPGLARRTGLQAHDFASGLGAPEVLLTRAVREGSAPSVASRFWQRLRAAAGGLPDSGTLSPPAKALLAVARSLDRAADVRFDRPEPCPPANVRPRELSVTEVATLKADPFAFYARRILGLKPLDPRDAEPTAGDRGQAVHKVLERVLEEQLSEPQSIARLIDAELAKLGDRPELVALWRPRVQRMIDWALEQIDADANWTPSKWEEDGTLQWQGVTLKGRVDRIDSNGRALRVIDYKTGKPPDPKDVKALYQTQLALLAVMAARGEFGLAPGSTAERLDYLKLSGGRDPGQTKPALGKATTEEIASHVADALTDYQQLVAAYLLGDAPFRAKQHMVYGRRFRDFDQLARVAEWLGR